MTPLSLSHFPATPERRATYLLSVAVNLPIVEISHLWNWEVCPFWAGLICIIMVSMLLLSPLSSASWSCTLMALAFSQSPTTASSWSDVSIILGPVVFSATHCQLLESVSSKGSSESRHAQTAWKLPLTPHCPHIRR